MTIRKHSAKKQKSIVEGDLAWIFTRNCKGIKQVTCRDKIARQYGRNIEQIRNEKAPRFLKELPIVFIDE